MKIVVTATIVVNEFYPGKWGPGKVFVFSDNLSWQTIDGNAVAGPAGTHSGTHRALRLAEAGDAVFSEDTAVYEYEATFALRAVDYGGKHLDAGQVTARGVWAYNHKTGQLFNPEGQPVSERRYAVTGGTGPYRRVRGHGFESANGLTKTLEIDL
jgi:hypothetical protein